MKNPFNKKAKFPTETPPRSEQEINTEYTSLCAQLGQTEYNVFILGKRIEWIRESLAKVDREMAKRQDLNKAAKQAEEALKP